RTQRADHAFEASRQSQELGELLEPRVLEARLDQLFASAIEGHALVGIACGAQTRFALHGPSTDGHFDTGCITRLFTASLVIRAVLAGHFQLGDRIIDLLGADAAAAAPLLAHVRVRHLLEDTHGLDDTAISRVPRDGDSIDLRELCSQLAQTGPLSEPGRFHSHANVGAWLSAAILERHLVAPYTRLLREQLFEPLG